jgi:cytosine/adenosine deaminase-related metal-dependent hydrolase
VAHGSGPSLRKDTIDAITAEWVGARDLGVRIHTHAGAGADDGGAVVDLKAASLLGRDVTLIHCSHLSGPDLDAIESVGAGVVLTPSTEKTEGMGAPPVQAMLDHGIDFGLGVDNVTEAPSDIFAQMRATISLQHATFFDLKLAGKAGLPNMMTTRSSIKQATIHGASAVGLGEITGSLEAGKQADIIMLRTDRPNILPVNDPIGAVVWGMDTSNLDRVFVAGRPMMTDGVLAADVAEARRLAIEAFTRVASSAGLLADASSGGLS